MTEITNNDEAIEYLRELVAYLQSGNHDDKRAALLCALAILELVR